MQKEHWTAVEAARMLANPYYTGIQVHPEFLNNATIPASRKWLIHAAKEKIKRNGAATFLRNLLHDLKNWNDPDLRAMRIHQAYGLKREPLITEDMFIECGVLQMATSVDKYLEHLFDNLESPGHAMSLLCK
jgi:hypothetical protein